MAEFRKKRKKICHMCAGKTVDYKDVNIISKYINDNGKILPKRSSKTSKISKIYGLCTIL